MSNNWQTITPYGVPNTGSAVVGGGGTPLAGYRDALDALRSAAIPRTPNAEYPDGYLGNVVTRRSDRLLQNVQSRLTQRNYQRGVHKGEKIDQSDYFWPDEFNPETGLQYEAQGLKWTVGADGEPPINHMGKNHLVSAQEMYEIEKKVNTSPMAPIDPRRAAAFQRLLPSWS